MDAQKNDFTQMNAYFNRPRSKRDVHIASTVLVHQSNNIWFLGFLQDAQGENVRINYNCQLLPVAWVNKDRVFPHPLVGIAWSPTTGASVYVAVRLEKNGPYVFVSGRQLVPFQHMWVYVCYVEINLPNGECVKQIVHRQQIVQHLPVMEQSRVAIVIEKHVVQYDMPVFREGIDEVGLFRPHNDPKRDFLANWGIPARYGSFLNERQFYVAVEDDAATFIWWNVNPRIPHWRSAPWNIHFTADSLKEFFARHALLRASLPLSNITELNTEGFRIGFLPINILPEIFQWLDAHSQAKVKRVCASWYTVSVTFASFLGQLLTVYLRYFNLQSDSHCCTETYRLALLLHRILQPHTVIQFVRFDNPTEKYRFIGSLEFVSLVCQQLCTLNNITLRAVCIADCTVRSELDQSDNEAAICDLRHIRQLLNLADFVILRDYTTEDPLGCIGGYYLDHLPVTKDYEKTRPSPIVPVIIPITIPQLMLRKTDTRTAIFRTFVAALERHCPEPSEVCQLKARALFEFWIQMVPYPDGFDTIPQMFKLLDGRYHGNSKTDSGVRDEMDLKNLDHRNASKLILHLLERWFG